MTQVPLGVNAYSRDFAQSPEIELVNRFLEKTPTNQVEGIALLSRPGTTFLTSSGDGPIRITMTEQGLFENDLFFVSGDALFRFDGTDTIDITGTILGSKSPSVAFIGGPGFEHLYIAAGTTTQRYSGLTHATGTLTFTGSISEGETVTIDSVAPFVYEWTFLDVDAASSNILVNAGTSTAEALANLRLAIDLTGIAGVDYAVTHVTQNTLVESVSIDGTVLVVQSRGTDLSDNSIATLETATNGVWGAATLLGGGVHALVPVITPDNVALESLASLAGFVLLSVQGEHKFFWILPGETTIDALNFASAESSPDDIIELKRLGDSLYMIGGTTTEIWYANAAATDVTLSFLRNRGIASSQGGRVGSVVVVLEQIILVGRDSVVYQIVGGRFQRISTNGIEEQIRQFRELTSDPFKAWDFTFDGHTFYVLTLEGVGTYAYDISTGQWAQFITEGSLIWNMQFGTLFRKVVVAGDAESSTIWQLDPNSFKDNHILTPSESFEDMTRVVTGGLPVRQRVVVPNYAFYLTASMGAPDPSTSATIELAYSDDGAHTFTSAGVLNVDSGDFIQRLQWRSLGRIQAPNRVFRVTDVGAIARIDGADADVGENKEQG